MSDAVAALNIGFVNLPLMAAAGLLLANAVAAVVSARLGFSFLLEFFGGVPGSG